VRTFNLADNELKSIAAFASRIAVLLSKPDIKADDDQTGVLDDLLGAVYPLHDWTETVTHCGRICYKSRKVNLSSGFTGQDGGVKQVDDHLWLVTFMDYDLGYFDDETCRLEPIANPFGPKLLPMSPE
jgi:hypothetical protein